MQNGNPEKRERPARPARRDPDRRGPGRGDPGRGGPAGRDLDQDDPLWVPYSPPPSEGERGGVAAAVRKYGFAALILTAVTGLVGALLWFALEMGGPGQEASARDAAAPAQPDEQAAENNPYAGTATLSVTSSPAGATVLMGGDALGTTPLTDRVVPAGVHFVTVTKEEYGTVDSVLVVRSDQVNALSVTLRAAGPSAGAAAGVAEGEGPAEGAADSASAAATAARGATPEADAASEAAGEAPTEAAEPAEAEPTEAEREAAREAEREAEAQREAQREAAAAEARRAARARSFAGAMQRGNDHFIEGDYAEARRAYEDALAIRPNDEKAADRLRRTDSLLAEREEAQAQYQYYRARGDVLFEQGRYQDAVAAYRQALERRPGDAYVQGRLSRSRAEARAALDEAAQAAEAAAPAETETSAPNAADLPAREAAPARLNLNTATAAQLERLPGIGPRLSQRIVEERETYGRFRSVGDLTRVRGIGPGTVEEIEELVFVEGG